MCKKGCRCHILLISAKVSCSTSATFLIFSLWDLWLIYTPNLCLFYSKLDLNFTPLCRKTVTSETMNLNSEVLRKLLWIKNVNNNGRAVWVTWQEPQLKVRRRSTSTTGLVTFFCFYPGWLETFNLSKEVTQLPNKSTTSNLGKTAKC